MLFSCPRSLGGSPWTLLFLTLLVWGPSLASLSCFFSCILKCLIKKLPFLLAYPFFFYCLFWNFIRVLGAPRASLQNFWDARANQHPWPVRLWLRPAYLTAGEDLLDKILVLQHFYQKMHVKVLRNPFFSHDFFEIATWKVQVLKLILLRRS